VLLGNSESEETALAKANAAAHKEQAAAIKSAMDAERGAADSGLALKQAHLDEKQAQERVNELRKAGKTHTDAYKQAVLDLERATFSAQGAQSKYTSDLEKQNAVNDKAIKGARDRLDAARKTADQLAKPVLAPGSRAGVTPEETAQRLKEQAQAQQNVTKRVEDYVGALARSNVSDLSRQRLMHASNQVTQANAQGISDLIGVIGKLPTSKQTKILLSGNQNVLAQVGALAASLKGVVSQKTIRAVLTGADSARGQLLALRAVIAGVPPSKVTKVLANTGSARAEIAALKSLIDSLQNKQVQITTNLVTNRITHLSTTTNADTGAGGAARPHAAGRGPGGAERSLVGEGAAPEYVADPETGRIRKVSGPALLDLKPDEYVIPTEDRYRGRALGLLADLMRDLGIEGYKAGKKPKKHRLVPAPPKDYHVADPDVLSSEVSRLQQLSTEKDKSGKHLTAKAREARRELPAVRAAYRRAHAAAAAVEAEKERADNAYTALTNADKRDDQKGFDRQLGLYNKALKGEAAKLATIWDALGKAGKRDTKYGRAIQAALLDVQGKAIDAASLTNQPEQDSAAQILEDTGLTKDETAALKRINESIALAALTPDLADDTAAAGALVTLLQGALNRDLATGAAPDVITDIAGQLKTAQDNLTSLTSPGGASNTNPDLQAQLDQAIRQRDNATAEAQFNAQALSVFKGFTDVGTGPQVNVYTLHPGDPATLRAIGDAATSGIDLQPARRSPVQVLGA
jgi:hypothetical protein